jgi:hypothetical protein
MVDFGWPFLFVLAVFLAPVALAAGILVLLLFGSVTAGRIIQTAAAGPLEKAEFCGFYHSASNRVSLIVIARRVRHPVGAPGGGAVVLRGIEDGDKRVRLWNKSQRGN